MPSGDALPYANAGLSASRSSEMSRAMHILLRRTGFSVCMMFFCHGNFLLTSILFVMSMSPELVNVIQKHKGPDKIVDDRLQ